MPTVLRIDGWRVVIYPNDHPPSHVNVLGAEWIVVISLLQPEVRRWVVKRSFAWATRCRRLVKDYERYATTLASFYVIAFIGYILKHAVLLMQSA